MTFPPNNGAGPKATKARRRSSLTSDLGEKTASQAEEIGQYAQSHSGMFGRKSLWFLNRAVSAPVCVVSNEDS